jgi:hypothetical protein
MMIRVPQEIIQQFNPKISAFPAKDYMGNWPDRLLFSTGNTISGIYDSPGFLILSFICLSSVIAWISLF